MKELIELQCPACDRRIKIAEQDNNKLACKCGKVYPTFTNVIDFLPSEAPFYEEKYQTKWRRNSKKESFPNFYGN